MPELARIQTEHAANRPCPTVGYAYRAWRLPWLERRRASGSLSERTRESYTRSWKLVIEPKWGKAPPDAIRPLDVQQWAFTLTASSAHVAVIVLRKLLDFAVQCKAADSNRLRLPYEMPTAKALGKRERTYGLEEARTVLRRLRGTRILPVIDEAQLLGASPPARNPGRGPFIVACFGGAQAGESLGTKTCGLRPVETHPRGEGRRDPHRSPDAAERLCAAARRGA